MLGSRIGNAQASTFALASPPSNASKAMTTCSRENIFSGSLQRARWSRIVSGSENIDGSQVV